MVFSYRFSIIIIALLLSNCARVGRPSGGKKDTTPPKMTEAKPVNKNTFFNKKEIKIYFNEYITLKNINNQLIISPPLNNPPVIYPQGTPSKFIKIKVLDTLKQNTTYTFNFGNSIQDNNEGNKLENFKYILSTGKFIDSLYTKGSVNNTLKGKLKENISVLLYKIDSAYNDSTPFKKKPTYVTQTTDSVNFKFNNLKKGKYAVIALKENIKNYIFNSKTDEIGFLDNHIELPKDSIINTPISIFKEEQPFKFKQAKEISKGKIQFGFVGKKENFKIKLLTKTDENFKSFNQFEKDKDTLNYWFTPTKNEKLKFIVLNNKILDTVEVALRKNNIDSLNISLNINDNLHLKDTLFLTTNTPITNFDKTKINLIDKDSSKVNYELKKSEINKISILFNKKPENRYSLTILPNFITDIYRVKNDSLNYSFSTKKLDEYGNIILNIKNEVKKPLIIELIDNNKVIKTKYAPHSKKIEFNLLEPTEYQIRAIIDSNNNKKWDTGNFFKKIQPEKIIYYNEKIKLRENWTINNTFIVK